MLLQQSCPITLSPAAKFVQGIAPFKDHSVVIIQVDPIQKSTTFRYFSKQNYQIQKHIVSYPRLFFQFGCIVDKEIFFVDIHEGQIIVLDFYKDNLNKTIHEFNQLKNDSLVYDLITFTDSMSFVVSIHCNPKNSRQVYYFEYPNKLIQNQSIQNQNHIFTKLNEKGQMGLFNPSFSTFFIINIINLQDKCNQQFHIKIQNTATIRDVYKISKDKIIILPSNNLQILICDVFTQNVQKLIKIKSQQFSIQNINTKKQTKYQNNIIFNWIPLKEYVVIIARNTQLQAPIAIYTVNYNKKVIRKHQGKLNYHYKSLRGEQYYQANYNFKKCNKLKIKFLQVVPHEQLICYLADEGLGLSVEMVEMIVKSIQYNN